MFFLVLMSHSVGRPFADDTMFRSGVPPHIGQSPLPGSDAETRDADTATKARRVRRRRYEVMIIGYLLGVEIQVVEIGAELRIDKESRRA